MASIEKGDKEIIHVSTGQQTSINQIIQILRQIHDCEINVVRHHAKPGDIKHSCLNNDKAKHLLNVTPLYNIHDGLRHTYLFETT